MSDWAPEYVFRWLSQRLFGFGCVFGETGSESCSKVVLSSKLRVVLSFHFGDELSSYLASSEYGSFFSLRAGVVNRVVNPALGNVSSPVAKVPLAAQWCMQHAKFVLGLFSQPCAAGNACGRLHPALTRPFSDSVKYSLRGLANIIKVPAQKDVFLAAII